MARTSTLPDVMKERDYTVDPSQAIGGGTRSSGNASESARKLTDKDVAKIISTIFPVVDCGEDAMDAKIIIQKLKVPDTIRGSTLIRSGGDKDADEATVSIAKVVSLGPLAFISDVTGNHKYLGAIDPFKVGDLVRVPKIGGQHLSVDGVHFYYIFDTDVHGKIRDLARVASLY